MSNRLDPVGRLRLPRRSTMLRISLVAALLLTAAGVLYAGPQDSADPGRRPVAAVPTADPDRLPIPDGLVGVPVPLAEPTALAVLRAGDHVDLLAIAGAEPAPVAGDAAVLAVDHAAAAVLLALTPDQASEVVSAPDTTRFAVIVRS
jgi:hypothetical protein